MSLKTPRHWIRCLGSAFSVALWAVLSVAPWVASATAQQPAAQPAAGDAPKTGPERGSLIEDRAARKLLEAGDQRLEQNEAIKAVEIWQSVIERYPRSRVRFEAHMRLGNLLLERERAYDRARTQFEAASVEENRDEGQRAAATLKTGVCFYEARNFGKCFQLMRDVIEKFPISSQVNEAYYYIGLAHFQLGHYSRAISALEKVGTTISVDEDNGAGEGRVEAGKRLFVKIEDADLAVLEPDQTVKVKVATPEGDEETLNAYPVGRNVRVALGSIVTALGKPSPNNGRLEVLGQSHVIVTYTDSHTADRQFDKPRERNVAVVGNAVVRVMDGAYRDSLQGIVLDRDANLEIVDADFDVTDGADTLAAVLEVYREKADDEYQAEVVAAEAAAQQATATGENRVGAEKEPEVSRFKLIDRLPVKLTEVKVNRDAPTLPAAGDEDPAAESVKEPAAAGDENKPRGPSDASADDKSIHTGVFRLAVPLARAEEPNPEDNLLQALPSDYVHLAFVDERNSTGATRTIVAKAKCLEGNLGGVRVTRAEISDKELEIQTKLRTAAALTNIGNRYKEFGLKSHAEAKYQQALHVCEEISDDAGKLGGRLLEETYVQLWKVYYEMENLDLAAAMCQRLQREFPNSGFVDDAMLQLADVVKKQGDLERAIGIYSRLVAMPTSKLRGEAQYGVADCYEQMAKNAQGPASAQLYDRSFNEYKKVFESFPDSGRVGEAVAKMANYYYQQKDYSRAIDVFETVLTQHPDAKFLDVILFNYGRCLYRMDRKAEARKHFDQLIAEFPESPLAADAKKISDALAKAAAPAKSAE